MSARYRLKCKPQYKQWNGINYAWKDSTNPPVPIEVIADSNAEAEERARELLPKLGTDWRYIIWPESVEDIPAQPEPEPMPTILTRTPKGFRYKGV